MLKLMLKGKAGGYKSVYYHSVVQSYFWAKAQGFSEPYIYLTFTKGLYYKGKCYGVLSYGRYLHLS
jgi:hypothetical protein